MAKMAHTTTWNRHVSLCEASLTILLERHQRYIDISNIRKYSTDVLREVHLGRYLPLDSLVRELLRLHGVCYRLFERDVRHVPQYYILQYVDNHLCPSILIRFNSRRCRRISLPLRTYHILRRLSLRGHRNSLLRFRLQPREAQQQHDLEAMDPRHSRRLLLRHSDVLLGPVLLLLWPPRPHRSLPRTGCRCFRTNAEPGVGHRVLALGYQVGVCCTAFRAPDDVLFYYDHNVSSLTAQARQYPLKKPAGFHWDFFLLGCTCFVGGILGLPLPNGLVPQAPVHTDSLTVYETRLEFAETKDGGEIRKPVVEATAVVDQRMSHFLMGMAFWGTMTGPLLTVVHLIPAAVFAGVFFVVGVSALCHLQLPFVIT